MMIILNIERYIDQMGRIKQMLDKIEKPSAEVILPTREELVAYGVLPSDNPGGEQGGES